MLLTPVERSHRPQRASIRRGEFRSYTFRLGAQAPHAEITLGLDSDDGCLVLYRAPHEAAVWRVVETVVAPVSWNPELKFHIARKVEEPKERI